MEGIEMKKVFSVFLIILLSLISVYAIVDLVSSIYLVARYGSVNACSSGLLAGKALFIAACIAIVIMLNRLIRKKIH